MRRVGKAPQNEFVCNGGGITYTCDQQFRVLERRKSKFMLESLRPPICSRGLGMLAGAVYNLDGEEPKRVKQVSADEKD